MHDPMVVVFEVRRPWPTRRDKSGWRYWPPVVTVWHNEPRGHDSGTICKGMGSSGLSPHNLLWAVRHVSHLSAQVQPYLRVKRWLFDRCPECKRRFFWKDGRFGYMSSDAVYHDQCMSLRHVRSQLDDLTAYVRATADDNARWRVEYRLRHIDDQAEIDAL